MTRIAVLGDLSGHLAPFVQALGELGVDVAAARVPDDLVVVQVGDLVHKEPDSDTIVALVNRLLDANPGRYLQLLGNHEDQYLGGQRFYEHTPLAGGTIATLRRWRASGRLRVAAALWPGHCGRRRRGSCIPAGCGRLPRGSRRRLARSMGTARCSTLPAS